MHHNIKTPRNSRISNLILNIIALIFILIITLSYPSRSILTKVDYHNEELHMRSIELYNTTSSTMSARMSGTYSVVVVGIFVDQAELPISARVFELTLKLAIENINRRYHPRFELKLIFRNASSCSHQYAGAIAAEEYFVNHARLFVISGCDDAIKGVSQMASSWQIPVMTAAGIGSELNNKVIFKTLTRVAFSFERIVEFLIKILKSFKWHHISMIVDETDPNNIAIKDSIQRQLQTIQQQSIYEVYLNSQTLNIKSLINLSWLNSSRSINTTDTTVKILVNSSDEIRANDPKNIDFMLDDMIKIVLKQAASMSRIMILLVDQKYLRRILLNAHDIGLANGQYTFLNAPLYQSRQTNLGDHDDLGDDNQMMTSTSSSSLLMLETKNNLVWYQANSKHNRQAKKAFESLMSLYVKTPVTNDYVFFVNNLTRALNNGKQQQRSSEDSSINSFTASFYDCIQIYADVLNRTLQLPTSTRQLIGSDIKYKLIDRHELITKFIWNSTIDKLLTGAIYINENGDREADYTLDDMNQQTGIFQPVILFNGRRRNIERLGRIQWSSDQSVGPTLDVPDCNLTNSCTYTISNFTLTVLVVALLITFTMIAVIYLVHKQIQIESQLVDYWWKITIDEIEPLPGHGSQLDFRRRIVSPSVGSDTASGIGSFCHGANSIVSNSRKFDKSLNLAPSVKGGLSETIRTSSIKLDSDKVTIGVYKSLKVAIRPIPKLRLSRKVMIDLRMIKDFNHSNLCKFIGIVTDEPHTAMIFELCPKASLREFFHNESIVIDWTFKYSIMNDIIEGLNYIHNSPIEFHGRLKTTNCLVDSRFMVKLSDYGLRSIYSQLDDEDSEETISNKKIWTAPEHLRSSGHGKGGSKKGDIYSFGIILYEIITNQRPYNVNIDGSQTNDDHLKYIKDVLDMIKTGPSYHSGSDIQQEPMRPDISDIECSKELAELLELCWHENPIKRPDSQSTKVALRRITKGITSKKLLENLTSRMEQYTNNLETMVDAKLQTILEEKLKTEEILYQFVPRSLAELMKLGQTIDPEAFDCVTVFYSDIVGFTSLSAQSTPMQVIDFLSDLYSCFDETLEQYDTYKVDTVGDAYIVASGLPNRNGDEHANEIAKMAIHLRERVSQFKIKHKPKSELQMRVGIHSGPCVAGLVGVEMQKYCLFGDTIAIARFMESNGQPMKIHVTEESKLLLERLGGFSIKKREPEIIRDGKPFTTYWLDSSIDDILGHKTAN